MGVRTIQFFLLVMGFVFNIGTLAEQSAIAAPPLLRTAKNSNISPRHGAKKLQIAMEMPQMDVVTPTTTIPVINPTTTPATATTTTPVYNPFQSPTNPTVNPVTTPSMVTAGQGWCVASQSASPTALQVALDYACGYGGADCSAIQPGGSCYNPDTVRDHASYAFNNYYHKNPIPTSCDFGGTAIISSQDPSTSACQFPSSSGASTTVPAPGPPTPTGSTTTPPTGPTIYGGSVPSTTTPTGSGVYDGSDSPITSGSVSVLKGMRLVVVALTCLLAASLAFE